MCVYMGLCVYVCVMCEYVYSYMGYVHMCVYMCQYMYVCVIMCVYLCVGGRDFFNLVATDYFMGDEELV